MLLLLSLALATDPATSCPGAQLCDGACISLVQLCAAAPPAAPPVQAVPDNDICRTTPAPKAAEPVVTDEAGRIAAKAATCLAAGLLGGACGAATPSPYATTPEPNAAPCGGPPVPAAGEKP